MFEFIIFYVVYCTILTFMGLRSMSREVDITWGDIGKTMVFCWCPGLNVFTSIAIFIDFWNKFRIKYENVFGKFNKVIDSLDKKMHEKLNTVAIKKNDSE